MKVMKNLIFTSLCSLILFSCGEDESSNEFWNEIDVSAQRNTFSLVFSSSDVGTCFDHGENNLEKVTNSEIDNINGSKVIGVVAFPSITDNLFSPAAEELKFIFDGNGNGTFQSYPALINDNICFNIDSLAWHESIKDDIAEPATISLGSKTSLKGSTQTVYVKGVYNKSLSTPHSIALYVIEKSKTGNQKNNLGSTVPVAHKNVLRSSATNTFGKNLSSAQSSEEFHEKFQFELDNVQSSEIYFVAVVYSVSNNTPSGVINCIRF